MEFSLIPARRDLAKDLLDYRQDPVTVRYNPLMNFSLEDLEKRLTEASSNLRDDFGQKDFFQWFVQQGEEITGQVNLSGINRNMLTAEIGYGTFANFRGKGSATASLKLLVQLAFTESPLRKLFAFVHTDNTTSQKVLEKIGFCKEGCLREHFLVNGKPTDQIFYGLLRSDLHGG